MTPSPRTVSTLLRWCAENDIWIDPRLEVRHTDATGIAVYSTNDIPPNTSLVHIHRNSVLSVRSCSLSDAIEPTISGPLAQLSLSLALYVELLNGENSRWFGYLQSLPSLPIPLPILWAHDFNNGHDITDGKEGQKWLRGTEVERYLAKHPEQSLAVISSYYFCVAEPLLLQHLQDNDTLSRRPPNLNGFYRAYTLVSSRAFIVDAYHGLSMVPIADAFNHSQENHIHLQTEFDVCFYCGSLYECLHDTQSSSDILNIQHRRKSTHVHDLDSYYEMVSNSLILPHEEVLNTYGETLTNAQLLVQYGFILDVNDNDRLAWEFKDVCADYASLSVGACSSDLPGLEHTWSAVLSCATVSGMLEKIAESNLVYVHNETSADILCLDGEGKISHPLWLLLALPFCLQHVQGNLADQLGRIAGNLEMLLDFQMAVERALEHNDENSQPRPSSTTYAPMLAGVAQSLVNLCLARKSQLGKPLPDGDDINGVLDDLPSDMFRAREALTIAIGERSVLESCVSAWEDITLLYPA